MREKTQKINTKLKVILGGFTPKDNTVYVNLTRVYHLRAENVVNVDMPALTNVEFIDAEYSVNLTLEKLECVPRWLDISYSAGFTAPLLKNVGVDLYATNTTDVELPSLETVYVLYADNTVNLNLQNLREVSWFMITDGSKNFNAPLLCSVGNEVTIPFDPEATK